MRNYTVRMKGDGLGVLESIDRANVNVLAVDCVETEEGVTGNIQFFAPKACSADGRDVLSLSREEIADWLGKRIESGDIIRPISCGSIPAFLSLVNKREYSKTPLKSVAVKGDSVGNPVYDKLLALINEGRVLDLRGLAVHRDIRTLYKAQQAVIAHDIAYLRKDGIKLYID